VWADGQTDVTKLIVASHNFAKSPENGCTSAWSWFHTHRINLGINFHHNLSNLLFVQAEESCSGRIVSRSCTSCSVCSNSMQLFKNCLFSDAARSSVIKMVQQLVDNELKRM
jgi:hypothetical protein